MRAAGIHGEKLAPHVEEADIRVAAEGGVHQAAALLGKPRGRAYESPRDAVLLTSGAGRHEDGETNCRFLVCLFVSNLLLLRGSSSLAGAHGSGGSPRENVPCGAAGRLAVRAAGRERAAGRPGLASRRGAQAAPAALRSRSMCTTTPRAVADAPRKTRGFSVAPGVRVACVPAALKVTSKLRQARK